MLRLDEDLSPFYRVAAADPALAWVATRRGRMLRSPTVFEDVVKTICTTNCAWSGTVRMVGALVGELGRPAEGVPDRRALPEPRGDGARPTTRSTATSPAPATAARTCARWPPTSPKAGLTSSASTIRRLSDDEVAEQLLALAGVGPYAMAHVMMLIGRYRRLVLDSWTRPKYRRLSGRARITDKGIIRAFGRYRDFAGLAFWLTLTEDWLAQDERHCGRR